jgi:hypothetical protein
MHALFIVLRVLVGICLAPGFSAALLYLGMRPFHAHTTALEYAIVLAVPSYIGSVVLGLPADVVLRCQRLTRLRTYLLCAAGIAWIVSSLAFVFFTPSEELGLFTGGYATTVVAAVASAALTALAYWLIAVRKWNTRDHDDNAQGTRGATL